MEADKEGGGANYILMMATVQGLGVILLSSDRAMCVTWESGIAFIRDNGYTGPVLKKRFYSKCMGL